MGHDGEHVRAFYDRHPISPEQILASVQRQRGHLDDLVPADLWEFDQDHYGGLAVVDVLAHRVHAGPGLRVMDLCSGLGGPARYLAHHYGCSLTCVEINARRAAGSLELTRRVGLTGQVRVLRADAQCLPLAAGCVDAVISQEALLHVPDKTRALAECARVLAPGGRIAFTDWVVLEDLDPADRSLMWEGIAAQTTQTPAGYHRILERAGLVLTAEDDLTGAWGDILAQRLQMFRRLRQEAAVAGNPQGDEAFYVAYVRLVQLVQERRLGGARFCARKPLQP